MTIIRVADSAPRFTLLSTDIADNTFSGAKSFLGAVVIATDTGKKYYIKSDGTLAEWTEPVTASIDSSATNPVYSVGLSEVVTQNIASGESVAATAFDMSNYIGGMVMVPSAWTAANIGFYVCDTVGGTYVIAKDKTGVPIQISTIATGAAGAYAIPVEIFTVKFVKLWSKSAVAATETGVNQADARILKVMLK